MKKLTALILAALIAVSCLSALSASAVTLKKIAKIKQTASKTDSATVKWSKLSSKDVTYEIKLSNGNSGKRTYSKIKNNTYKIKNLKAGKTYSIKIRAKQNKDKGEWSDVYKITTAPKVYYQWENGNLNISWTKVKGATSYTLKTELDYNKNKYARIKKITSTSYTITSENIAALSVNKVYNIYVRPYIDSAALFTGKATTRDIEVTGHRGRMDIAPENTLVSFEEAYKAGYDSVEADFWETKSGDIIICHDSILSMCKSGDDIRDISAANLKKYPIKIGTNVDKYPTQYLPTLEQVVKAVASRNMLLYLHLKDPKITDNGLKTIRTTIGKYGMANKITVFSQNKEAFERIIKAGIRPGFLNLPNSKSDIEKSINYAGKKKAKVMIFRFSEYMTADLIKSAHSKGIKLGCYNVSDKNRGSIMSNMGADFLITNKFFFK